MMLFDPQLDVIRPSAHISSPNHRYHRRKATKSALKGPIAILKRHARSSLYQSKHRSHSESQPMGPHDEAERMIGHQDRLSLSAHRMLYIIASPTF